MNKDGFSAATQDREGRQDRDTKSAKRSRHVLEDAAAQLSRIKTVGLSIGDEVGAYVRKQPLAGVGIAAGVGFALGSVLGSRLGRLALVAGVGYVFHTFIEEGLGEGSIRRLVDEVSKRAKEDQDREPRG